MEIFINDIPEEGLHEIGQFAAAVFDLDPNDSIRALGPATYEVHIHKFEEIIAFYGQLKGSFQLQCGTCLEYVDYDADFPDWNSDLDLEEKQRSFVLEQVLREDFLLNLPEHLRCDEIHEDRTCPKASFVEKVTGAPEDEEPESNPDVWKALDDL